MRALRMAEVYSQHFEDEKRGGEEGWWPLLANKRCTSQLARNCIKSRLNIFPRKAGVYLVLGPDFLFPQPGFIGQ
jgi:hypothetical protein